MRVVAAAPHYSLIDPLVMNWLFQPCSVAKKDVAKLPIIGSIARALSTIFVDRNDPASRSKTVAAIKERAKAGSGWPPILIFPEGTCTNGNALITFKAGPFLPGEPVQPVALRYPFRSLSLSGAASDAYTRLIWGMLQVYNVLHVTMLPMHTPTAEERADPNKFASAVRDEMAKELAIPCTSHTHEDMFLAMTATRYGIDTGATEMARVKEMLSLDAKGVKHLLERFHALDSSGSGTLGLDEFIVALSLEDAPRAYASRLFSFFDTSGDGEISYAEVVQGLALLSPQTSAEEKVKLAFLLCDVDASGGVSLSNLVSVLQYANDHRLPVGGGDAPAAPPSGAADEGAVPFLQRSESKMEEAFAKYDVDGNKLLDYQEFCAFLRDNPDVLQLSASMIHEKLEKAELVEDVESTIAKVKTERVARKSITPAETPPQAEDATGTRARKGIPAPKVRGVALSLL